MPVERRFLTVAETAEALRVGESTIRAAIKRDEIGAVRIRKHLRVPMTELERLLREPDSRP